MGLGFYFKKMEGEEEKFIENGDYEKLPGNQQTLRNYIHYLEDSGQINREPEHRRIYDYVFDTPPGEQMLIDFGEQTLSKTKSIHFICLYITVKMYPCSGGTDTANPAAGNRCSGTGIPHLIDRYLRVYSLKAGSNPYTSRMDL